MIIELLPTCPQLPDADQSVYSDYIAFIQDITSNGVGYRPIEWHKSAEMLAANLHTDAMRLGMSRAYEFSGDIYFLDQCAAVVSFIAFGRKSNLFEKYEAILHQYALHDSTLKRVAEFDRFVQSKC